MRWFGAVAAMVILAGCSGASPEKLARFQSGKTSVDEVIASLGSPDRDEVLPDGSRMLVYLDQRARTKIANFIPGVSQFAGGWTVSNTEAGLMFGPNGLLRFHAWSADSQARMRVVGQAISPHTPKPAPADGPPEKQDPPPVSRQGAESDPVISR